MPTSEQRRTLDELRAAIDGVGADGALSEAARQHSERAEAGEDEAYAAAKQAGLRLLGGRAHAAEELREKLERRDHEAEVVDRVITRFLEVDLLDDAEFARMFVADKRKARHLSIPALRLELKRKGVAAAPIEAAIAEVDDEEEVQLAADLIARRWNQVAALPREKQERRLLGLLARRGFPTGVSARVVAEALESLS